MGASGAEDKNWRSWPDVSVSLDLVKWIYSEVRSYDTHYSTVRTGVSTFLIGVMFLVTTRVSTAHPGTIVVVTHDYNLILIILLLNIFMIYANLHFQCLTTACGLYQRDIEGRLRAAALANSTVAISLPSAAVEARAHIQRVFRETSFLKAIQNDLPAQLVVAGSIAYWVVMGFATSWFGFG